MSPASFVNRQAVYLRPDPARVVLRPFRPAVEPRDRNPTDKTRANHIVERVMGLDEAAAAAELAAVMEGFQGRHRNLLGCFEARADAMEGILGAHEGFSVLQRRLVGAYFVHEYSFESTALFNPSIVAHPDQAGVQPGALRFILSLRAVGEGHVSSLTFRTGMIGADGTVAMAPTARLAATPSGLVFSEGSDGDVVDASFPADEDISERVIFPSTPAQSNGIEDARFVAFDEGCGKIFYATYTAYSGRDIRSELLETCDFLSFRLSPLRGSASVNKGMALFPRRIGGRYTMIGRQDNENMYLIQSDDIRTWEGGVAFLKPHYSWEFVQIGNCGAPIELDEGWLLLTHGVGPVRQYAIGAVLLDKADPSRVLARSRAPLLSPDPSRREGYVPNVVYTCGAMRHGQHIILPYAISDSYTNFATMRIADLLGSMDGD